MMEKICIVEDTNNRNNTLVIPSTSSVSSIVKMIDSISIDLRKSMDKKVSEDCHHWSLREYCSDMRNKDVRKCAPFAYDGDDEERLREQLAPLHVPKFRWWQCQSCVQDIVVTTASEGQQTLEKASGSSSRGEENHDALMGLAAVCGQENGVEDVSNQQNGDQTLSLPGPITEMHKNGTAGEEDTARELDIVCVPERAASSAGVPVVPEPADNVAASDFHPFESRENNIEEAVAEVRAIDTSSRDMDVDGSASDKDAGAERQLSTEPQECDNGLRRSRQAPSGDSHRTKHQGSTSSCRRRKRKVRLLADIYADCERRSDQPASCGAVPEELASPASTSAPRKRKMTKEPTREVKLPSRKTKKVRASKGDAKTTIATIHISGSESEEDDASAGTGLRSHMPQQQTGNGTSSAQLDVRLSVGTDRQPGGSSKEDIGLELSLNSYVARQQEGSLDLNKNLDLSLGSSKKAAEAKTVREQRHEEDATMEIVELMAKHQYERSLPDAERNPCLAERIDDRDDEMTRLYNVHGSRVGPLQKEHNQGNDRVCGASNSMPLRHNFPQDVAIQTATYLPSSDQPGKRVRDLDLNRADPDDIDLGVLLECPFAANNTRRDHNRKEMGSVQSLPNEAIPAMQLLSLMDAGTQSRTPFSINVKKVLEKPFYPCNNHPNLTVDDRAKLFGKLLYPPSHQAKEYFGLEPIMCGSSGSMRHMPAAYYRPSIVASQQPEIAMRTYLPQQNQDWRSVRPVGTSGFSSTVRHCNPYQEKQKGLLGASPDAVFPLRTALNFTEKQKDMGSSHIYAAARPVRDLSEEKDCGENKNPAEFSIVEAENVYTIDGGNLKFSDDFPGSLFGGFNRQRFGITNLTADKGKGVVWGPAAFP